ncbi:MAG TPA: sensor histidine kinase N-terminal domain-containing protein, partial [Telluria sp.]
MYEPLYAPPSAEPEENIQHSLFGEILDWMLAPLLLLWPMSIAITYLVAKSIANQPFDHALEDSVTVLAQQVREIDGIVVARLPGSARDILRADDVESVYFQVTDP